jgi:hypothetical protein
MSIEAWKDLSAGSTMRGHRVSDLDKLLHRYHSGTRRDQIEALVEMFDAVDEYRLKARGSSHIDAVLLLGMQIVRVARSGFPAVLPALVHRR